MTPKNTLFLSLGTPDFWIVIFYEKWIEYYFSARWDKSNGILRPQSMSKLEQKLYEKYSEKIYATAVRKGLNYFSNQS